MAFALIKPQAHDDQTLSAVSTKMGKILDTLSLIPAPQSLTHLALTPNNLLPLISANGSVEPVNLSWVYNYWWKEVSYLPRAFWGCWLREYIAIQQARRKRVHSKMQFRADNVVKDSEEHVGIGLWHSTVIHKNLEKVKVMVAKPTLACDARCIRPLVIEEVAVYTGFRKWTVNETERSITDKMRPWILVRTSFSAFVPCRIKTECSEIFGKQSP